jgi:hypothetical protein
MANILVQTGVDAISLLKALSELPAVQSADRPCGTTADRCAKVSRRRLDAAGHDGDGSDSEISA